MSIRATCTDCGYTGKYKTQALAEHHHPKHSCQAHRDRLARAARVKARNDDPGVKVDCTHARANHQHGTRQAYILDKCRCRPCRQANRDHQNAYNRAKAYGRYDSGRVDADQARAHIARLMAEGVSLKRCSELSGVSHSTLGHIIYGRKERGEGPRKRIEKRVHDRILAVRARLEDMAPSRPVPGVGARRRLQALMTLGYSASELARRVGLSPTNIGRVLHTDSEVFVSTAVAARAVYDQLWNTPPQPVTRAEKVAVSRARNYAKAHGWAPPMAWDDDAIDNPDAEPQGVEPEQRWGRTEQILVEEVHHLLAAGASSATVCERLGRPRRSLERSLDRAGRGDLASWLRTGEQPATAAA